MHCKEQLLAIVWLRHCFGINLFVAHARGNAKLTQGGGSFVCNLVTSTIVTIVDLYAMYVDPLKRYNHPQFQMFNNLVTNICDVFHMVWYLEP
jgi:hypothetical protein